jgi:hypothetical protein
LVLSVLNVACVLRSGGDYTAEHVECLRRGIALNLRRPYRFVCLTDDDTLDCETARLVHQWPGWWAKIELFRPELFANEDVLYFDLDVLIVGSLDDVILDTEPFMILRSFWPNRRVNSSMMLWRSDLSAIYQDFVDHPEKHMASYRMLGDQDFIRDHSPVIPEMWQDRSDAIQSYKLGVAKHGLGDDTRVVIFHGKPRPWATDFGRQVLASQAA